MPSYHYRDGITLRASTLAELLAPFASKFAWFLKAGYSPHYWQTIFHTMIGTEGDILRFRHLVAGRRGGKTLSAAWEVLFYCLHPEQFHQDAHSTISSRPLHVWILTKDYPTGRAALLTFRECLDKAGLTHGVEYRENRGNRYFEFENGSLIEFKTAEDPQSLRGAGLDIMWLDEAAFITNRDAWDVARPALSDKTGLVICTTTPDGKNWYYDTFWSEKALADPTIGRVEYRSIDNPYFPSEEWKYLKTTYHPLLFKQEYMASFDSMVGRELPGDWLVRNFYTDDDLAKYVKDGKLSLNLYQGVDPAATDREENDRFAMALIGVADDGQVFLLQEYADHLKFADQLDVIKEWHMAHRPMMIGVESNAYQGVLAQQAMRLPTLPPIVPVINRAKKDQRILSMSALFKIGKVRVREHHREFIEEWLNYDSSVKNPKDDLLDAVEIALSTAGVLLPMLPEPDQYNDPKSSLPLEEYAAYEIGRIKERSNRTYDEMFGEDW